MKVFVNEKEYNFEGSKINLSDLLVKLEMNPSGLVAELDGDATGPVQQLFVYVQDDLTTGTPDLTSFTIRAQGRVFSP